MDKLLLYYNTLIHLSGRQILFQIIYRLRKIIYRTFDIKHSFTHYRQGRKLSFRPFIPKYESCDKGVFTFLNLSASFNGEWENRIYGDLWSFNLNYMEYLLQPSMSFTDGEKWIMRFIDSQENNGIGMSPYCISLRTVNWIKFVSLHYERFTAKDLERIDKSLYSQYRILLSSLEYNLLGNHLLENLFSLLWGAFYFADDKMFSVCVKNLEYRLNEQTLSDGANYEQSPMYHCIILDRISDCCNLLKNNESGFDGQQHLLSVLEKKASEMLSWLNCIRYSDGTLPMFNDSALGVAPATDKLFAYAHDLGIAYTSGRSDASGYHAVNGENYELRMDVGGITASYIPGHSHADTFNFEMRINGRPFIVDTSISTYQKDDRRMYERSTEAHNTVTVCDENSSRVWGGFRCAQRASATILRNEDGVLVASHDGYSRFGVTHTRQFGWNNKGLEILDNLGKKTKGKAFLHFAPDVEFEISECGIKTPFCEILFENADSIELLNCEVAGEYNRLQKSHKLCVGFTGSLKTVISL